MALTGFQRGICRLLARNRIQSGESYVAGGAALNEILKAPRLSRDLDLFHDTQAALAAAWANDRATLETEGYAVSVVRERPSFVEATVERGGEAVTIQWTQDSAYRFMPLVEHAELGLTLHAFDLATNKVLAMVGRVEPRDWVDVVACDQGIQPLGYLAWAACGKDPGFSPLSILEQAARSVRYSAIELAGLAFEGKPPDAAALSRSWHAALATAREIVELLPAERVGTAVLSRQAELFRGGIDDLRAAIEKDRIAFHEGAIHGAFPQIIQPH